MKTKRIICTLLCLLMLLSLLIGCGANEEEEAAQDTTVSTDDPDNPFDENGYLKDDLPEGLSFDGSEFRVLTWAQSRNVDWGPEEQYVTIVDQAIHARNLAVEDRFDIKLNITEEKGQYENRNEFVQIVENIQISGSTPYHLVTQYSFCAGTGAARGLYADLNSDSVKYVDTEKPWWPKYLNESASVGGKLYFASGDITVGALYRLHCMFANLNLYNELNLSDLVDGRSIYQVVEDGDWTLETYKMMEATIGNAENAEDQTYGMFIQSLAVTDSFFYAGGFTMVDNKSATMKISESLTSTTFADWFDNMQDMLCKDAKVFVANDNPEPAKEDWLFLVDTIERLTAEGMRDADFDYAVIPCFKSDKSQKEYFTTANFWISMYSIPTTNDNLEMSGAIMEGLASQSYRAVTYTAYEEGLKYRYAHFADDAKMLDIITDNAIYEPGRMFADQLSIYSCWRKTVNDDIYGWQSYYRQNVGTWNTKIDELHKSLNN